MLERGVEGPEEQPAAAAHTGVDPVGHAGVEPFRSRRGRHRREQTSRGPDDGPVHVLRDVGSPIDRRPDETQHPAQLSQPLPGEIRVAAVCRVVHGDLARRRRSLARGETGFARARPSVKSDGRSAVSPSSLAAWSLPALSVGSEPPLAWVDGVPGPIRAIARSPGRDGPQKG